MRIPSHPEAAPAVVSSLDRQRGVGHDHFMARALSRRNFLKVSAGTTGALLASGALASIAHADDGASPPATVPPVPIPGTVFPGAPFHIRLPVLGDEPSAITDFKGIVGLAVIDGAGTAGDGTRLVFEADIRFMQGLYVGVDGNRHHGTFAFT